MLMVNPEVYFKQCYPEIPDPPKGYKWMPFGKFSKKYEDMAFFDSDIVAWKFGGFQDGEYRTDFWPRVYKPQIKESKIQELEERIALLEKTVFNLDVSPDLGQNKTIKTAPNG
jgi:uncharacterized small protein (DUF1192 family)